MTMSDEEMLSGSEEAEELLDKGKGKEKKEDDKDEGPPAALPGAMHGHDLDNLPWSA